MGPGPLQNALEINKSSVTFLGESRLADLICVDKFLRVCTLCFGVRADTILYLDV